MKPQEPIPHNYSMRGLNLIFAISSLVLLASTALIVGYDYVRGWKWFQRRFMQLQQERIETEIRAAQQSTNKAEMAAIDKKMRENEVALAQRRAEYLRAQRDLDRWEGEHYAADQDYRFAKANLDAQRYVAETAVVQKQKDARAKLAEYNRQDRHVNDLNQRLQDVTLRRDAERARVEQWLANITELEEKKKQMTATIDLLNKQLSTVELKGPNLLLNLPMLDFIAPTMRIEQVELLDLFVDVNYMHVPRVDRCMTCHRAIDRPGFESKKEAERLANELQTKIDTFLVSPEKRPDMEERIAQLKRIQESPKDILNPWRTHPKIDTFVGSASPHPLLDFGCTSCHRGQDRATEFGRAGHVPPNRKMERRWKGALLTSLLPGPWDYEKRNWAYEVNKYLETPMHPRQHYEAGCLKCHSGQMWVDRGEKISKATQTVELFGCHACHKISNWRFTNLRKPGPDLNGIAEKTTPEWVFRWIAEPRSFRATTRMPSFFYQRNMVDPHVVPVDDIPQNIKFQDAEIHSIVAFLFAKSTHRPWEGPAAAGDPARGKTIVSSVGCMGCHIDTETVKDEKSGAMRLAQRDDFPLERNYGFNLTGTGTKTHAAWLYNWVKNPKAYYAGAPMPSLRLSDQEAADVTAYLLSLQKPDFLKKPVRPPDRQAVYDLAKGYLVNTLTIRDADAKLKRMPLQEQLVYLGQRSIEKYGCYSCHDIKGFEGLKPIGTELTTEGSKNIHLFDFGFAHDYVAEDGKHEHIQHNVPSWIYNKVRNPRIYDDKRAKAYHDKLKMPNFHLTPQEAERITTVVVGLTKERVAANKMAAADPRMRAIEEGRKLVSQNNCRGCHIVDGEGRAIAPTIADENFLPPDLSPQGARVQSPWLFNFLKDPTVMKIRPWMNVRMPTFHFTDQETNTLVTFFAQEGRIAQFDTAALRNPSPANVAIGRAVFAMLRCQQCHVTTPVDPENPPVPNVADTTSLAPNLTLSRIRLRHQWVPDWIRRPNEMIPGTRMPSNFPRHVETLGFESPLALAIDTPPFAQQKAALLPYFNNDPAQLRKTMADAVALTDYMRDYIWSIGITQMRSAAPSDEAPAMARPSLPGAPAVKQGSSDSVRGSQFAARSPSSANRELRTANPGELKK